MPMQTGKSTILNKLRKHEGAIKKHAGDQPSYGNQRLPGGINSGVAKLTEIVLGEVGVGKQNAGEPYLRLAGSVVEPFTVVDPETKQVIPVRGLQTSVIVMLCDTKKADKTVVPAEDNMATAMNHLKILGAPAELFEGGLEGFQDAIEAVKEAAPYFKFTTRKGDVSPQYPDPRVFETWHGSKGLEGYEDPGAPGEKVEDEGEPAPAKRPAAPAPGRNGTSTKPASAKAASKVKAPEPGEDEGDAANVDMNDLDSLVERATADDVAAQKQLTAVALKAGVDESDVDAARNWKQVKELIEAQNEAQGESTAPAEPAEEEEEAAEFVPVKGSVYFFRPLDPKTKKPGKKKVEVEVLIVNKADKTCSVKSLDDEKITKGVPFGSIEEGD